MSKSKVTSWKALSLVCVLVLGISIPLTALNMNASWQTEMTLVPESGLEQLAGTLHLPIDIDGDADFSTTASNEHWSGDGTYEHPFVISGLDIDSGDTGVHAISIRNTLVNFTIRDCYLTGATPSPAAGIYLSNVAHGLIINNRISSNHVGIQLSSSSSIVAINNSCTSQTEIGIWVYGSDSITLADNTCTDNTFGCVLEYSDYNTVVDNTYNDNTNTGMYLVESNNNTLSGNTYAGCGSGISLYQSHANAVVDSICNGNTDVGLRLTESSGNNLSGNACDRSLYGIYFDLSTSNTLSNNTCTGNRQSIYFTDSHSNIVVNTTCNDNNDTGIWLSVSDFNVFQWNTFADNARNAYDLGIDNVFDYNYWSDYEGMDVDQDGFGDSSHNFTDNFDPHPLVYKPDPPTWIQSPIDQSVEFGHLTFYYKLNVIAFAPLTWHLDNGFFDIDSDGVVTSRVLLAVGEYDLEVTVVNIYARLLTGSFKVVVQDTISPHWIVEPSNQFLQHGKGFDYQLPVADLSGIDYWILNDTSHFTLTTTSYHEGSTARIVNATSLSPGSYGLNITVYDLHGNRLSTVFSVTVEAVIIQAPSDPIPAVLLGTGIGGVVILIIAIVLTRKRS